MAKYLAPGYGSTPKQKTSVSSGTDKVKKAIRDIGALRKKKETFAGNLNKDVSSFAKGLIGLPILAAKAVWNNPKESAKTVGRFIKTTGDLAVPKDKTDRVLGPIMTAARRIYQTGKKYANTSYQEKEKTFNEQTKKYENLPAGERGAKIAGESTVKDIMQLLIDPGDTLYKRPFTGTLDALSLGAGKVLSVASKAGKAEIVSRLSKTARGQAVLERLRKAGDTFSPTGSLERKGYGYVSQELKAKRGQERRAVEGITRAEAENFTKKLGLSAEERKTFFRAINKERRTNVRPTHENPKIQKAIDWYLDKKYPQIQRETGIVRARSQKKAAYDATVSRDKAKILEEVARLKGVRAKKAEIGVGRLEKTRYTIDDILSSVRKELNTTGQKAVFGGANHIKVPVGRKRYSISDILNSARTEINRGKIIGVGSRPGEMVIRGRTKAPLTPTAQRFKEIIKRRPFVDAQTARRQDILPSRATQEATTKRRNLILNRKLTSPRLRRLISAVGEAQRGASEYSKAVPIQNYMHHYFAPSGETYAKSSISAPRRGFLKKSEDTAGFVEDPMVSIAGVRVKAALANIQDKFAEKIFNRYGTPQERILNTQTGMIDTATGKQLSEYRGRILPKDLVDELTRVENFSTDAMWPMKILWEFNRNWKPLATSVRPRYHLRNMIGNLYNAVFVGGMNIKAMAPALSAQMAKYIAGMRADSFAGKILKPLFKNNPDKKFIQMAIQDDVVGRGFFGADLNEMAMLLEGTDDVLKLIDRIENPAMIYRVPLLRQWLKGSQQIGQALEDHFRLALYIDSLKKGMSRAAAKERVNTHLFDYLDGIGKGDQYMKALIPFWVWTRFNVPLQLTAIYKLPIRHAAIQHGLAPEVASQEEANPNYEFLSDREKNMGSFKVGEVQAGDRTLDKYIRTQNVLPIQDITKLVDFAQFNYDDLGVTPLPRMVDQLRYMLNPPKDPNENIDYYGRPVEQFPGEQKKFLRTNVRGTQKEFLSAIPLITEINKAIGGSYLNDERPELKETAKTAFSPFSSFLADREKNMDYYINDFLRETKGSYNQGYEGAFRNVIKKIAGAQNPEQATIENGKILMGLLRDSGYDDRDLVELVLKTIISELKNKQKNDAKSSGERTLLQSLEALR